jgi:hypothetical protein
LALNFFLIINGTARKRMVKNEKRNLQASENECTGHIGISFNCQKICETAITLSSIKIGKPKE